MKEILLLQGGYCCLNVVAASVILVSTAAVVVKRLENVHYNASGVTRLSKANYCKTN